jgi:phage terminase large subunit
MAGLESDFYITKDEIINTRTNSKILFKGIKTSSGTQTANLKSLSGVTTFVLDEAEELVDEDVFDKIDFSIRNSYKQNRVILILNPTTKEHFIYNRFFESKGIQDGSSLTDGDTTYIHTTYKDNVEYLSESFLNQIESLERNNKRKYEHTILGGWLDKAEGVVFTNWRFGDFNPDTLQTSFGQDFGFSIDPTTLVEVAIDKTKRKIYIKEHLYKPKLTTSEIAQINKRVCAKSLIVADSAEPRLIAELQSQGCNIIATAKGAGSITAGLALMQDYELIIESNSQNIGKELNNYIYSDKKSGLVVDNFNHCFTASTLVETINGQVPINKIKIGDLVKTSTGYKRVLLTHNNGTKQVRKYSMQSDTYLVSLCSTKTHKIKTNKGWTQIQKLQSGQEIYLSKNFLEKNTTCTQMKGIIQKVIKDFIGLFGSITMEKFQKVTTFITKILTPQIIGLKTSLLLAEAYTLDLLENKGLKMTPNGLLNFKKKGLRLLKNGTGRTLVGSGIKNTVKNAGLIENTKRAIVLNAEKNIKQDTEVSQNIATITAKLNTIEESDYWLEEVFDITVEDDHEYFANGILVHNCLDAIRYNVFYQLSNPNSGKYFVY